MLNILITGGELNNKGAQAMTFVVVDQIRKRYPDSQISLLSPRDSMCSNAKNYRFQIISDGASNTATIFYKAGGIFKILKLTGKVTEQSIEAVNNVYGNVDCIIDISGYGYGSNWGLLNSFRYIVTRCAAAKAYHTDLYLMPQSFGPLDFKGIRGSIIKSISKLYFPYAKQIYAREKDGFKLLTKEYKLKNVLQADDIVLASKKIDLHNIFFNVEKYSLPDIPENSVAVIPNEKNNKHGNKEKNLQIYKEMMDFLLQQNKNIFLIYHAKEDLEICIELKKMYEENNGVLILQHEFACYEFDSLIAKFDYAIASRFHAVVHAYKNAIPCLILGWSVKYNELAEKFNQQEYVFNITGEFASRELIRKLQKININAEYEAKKIEEELKVIQKVNLFDSIFGKRIFHVGNINRRLCTSCGICAAVCPQKCISYLYSNGRYIPEVDEEKCIKCGACTAVCTCWKEEAKQYGNHQENEYVGSVLKAATAYAKNMEIRQNGTSGGVITAITEELLKNGMYDCAFLVEDFNYQDAVKTKRYERGDSLWGTAKSRYIPVLHTDAVEYIIQNKEKKVIIVAVPCAVHNFILTINKYHLKRENILLLGLFCDRAETYEIFQYFEDYTGKNIDRLYFRDKGKTGWPGNMSLRFKDGDVQVLPKERRTEIKEFFQMERCLYCIDKLNMYCDIAVGDNYTGSCDTDESAGANTLLIRTLKGKEVLEKVQSKLCIREINIGMVKESQHLSLRKENWKNAVLLRKKDKIDIYQTAKTGDIIASKDRKKYEKSLADLKLGMEYDYRKISEMVMKKRRNKKYAEVKRISMGILRRLRKCMRKVLG